jgi:hypothetical protein
VDKVKNGYIQYNIQQTININSMDKVTYEF